MIHSPDGDEARRGTAANAHSMHGTAIPYLNPPPNLPDRCSKARNQKNRKRRTDEERGGGGGGVAVNLIHPGMVKPN